MMTLSCVSCSKPVEIDLKALGTEISAGNLFLDELIKLEDKVVQNRVGLDLTLIKSGEFWMGTGVTGEEYGLFECNSEADAKKIAEQLETHRKDLYDTYASYAPDALPRIENAIIRQGGVYVVYISANEYQKAADIVDKAFK